MNAVNGFKIFRVTDEYWYMARTPEEAVAIFENDSQDPEYLAEREEFFGQPVELSEDDLDRLKYARDEDQSQSWSYRQQLAKVATPTSRPMMFATSEF
jgi:hypothetical protein